MLACLQVVDQVFPMLLMFGEAQNSKNTPASLELQFAAALAELGRAAKAVSDLTTVLVNLLQQLGALCSEQMRKSTVISGTVAMQCQISGSAHRLMLHVHSDAQF